MCPLSSSSALLSCSSLLEHVIVKVTARAVGTIADHSFHQHACVFPALCSGRRIWWCLLFLPLKFSAASARPHCPVHSRRQRKASAEYVSIYFYILISMAPVQSSNAAVHLLLLRRRPPWPARSTKTKLLLHLQQQQEELSVGGRRWFDWRWCASAFAVKSQEAANGSWRRRRRVQVQVQGSSWSSQRAPILIEAIWNDSHGCGYGHFRGDAIVHDVLLWNVCLFKVHFSAVLGCTVLLHLASTTRSSLSSFLSLITLHSNAMGWTGGGEKFGLAHSTAQKFSTSSKLLLLCISIIACTLYFSFIRLPSLVLVLVVEDN